MTEEEAFERGKEAYAEGLRMRMPATDFPIREALKGRKVGDPYNTMIMKAWHRGWEQALEEDLALEEEYGPLT